MTRPVFDRLVARGKLDKIYILTNKFDDAKDHMLIAVKHKAANAADKATSAIVRGELFADKTF
jgi:hypothetical protein